MVKKVLKYPNSFLRKPTYKILQQELINYNIIQDCLDTVMKLNGLAIAANQIGYSHRLFVINPDLDCNKESFNKFGHTFLNPEIIWKSDEIIVENEGCLSFPNLILPISRSKEIEISFLDIEGIEHKEKFSGLLAREMSHEKDHLDGILFIDYIKNGV